MPVQYLPHVAPRDNNQRQLRRRMTDVTSQVNQNVSDISSNTSAIATKAPSASPTFTGQVSQPSPAVLTAATTATSATAGSATALPATPHGYLEMQLNGETVRVPYYKP